MKHKLTDQQVQELEMLNPNGVMVYFEGDERFLYCVKEQTDNLMQKILTIQQSGKEQKLYPLEIHVAKIRPFITTDNIGKFYKQEYARLEMSSEEFLKKYFDPPYHIRHTKTKGKMPLYDYPVSTWLKYQGVKKHFIMFDMNQTVKQSIEAEKEEQSSQSTITENVGSSGGGSNIPVTTGGN